MASEIKLYVWPQLWDLPSFDPYSLGALLYLQLAVPGKFTVVECRDPDLSPSGQLPFLIHGQEVIASFSSIVRYVAGLARTEACTYPTANVDAFLCASTRSQRNAWSAHVEANLGDLVASALFASQENWDGLTLPGLATLFPVPHRYFVPQKLREAYKPRLESAGLWSHKPPEEKEKKTPFEKELRKKPKIDKKKFQQVFEKEKIVAKAKPILDIYSRLLGDNKYIFDNRISSLDVAIASRILLLSEPLCPDSTIKDLLTTSYPTLVTHAHHVQERILGSSTLPLKMEPHVRSIWSLLPFGRPFHFQPFKSQRKPEKTDEAKHVDRMRWGFVGLVLGSLCAYIVVVGAGKIKVISKILDDLSKQEEGTEDA